jgi:hypothetical protein
LAEQFFQAFGNSSSLKGFPEINEIFEISKNSVSLDTVATAVRPLYNDY